MSLFCISFFFKKKKKKEKEKQSKGLFFTCRIFYPLPLTPYPLTPYPLTFTPYLLFFLLVLSLIGCYKKDLVSLYRFYVEHIKKKKNKKVTKKKQHVKDTGIQGYRNTGIQEYKEEILKSL